MIVFRQPGDFGTVDAVTRTGCPGNELAQEGHLPAALFHSHAVIAQMHEAFFQMRKLVEMRRNERLAADPVMQELDDRLRDRHAFSGRGSAAKLIDDDKALARRLLGHHLDVHHLDHERALPADQIIGSADPREDSVGDRNARRSGRYETADLRHQADHGDLPHIGTFTGHVRSGNKQNAALILAASSFRSR